MKPKNNTKPTVGRTENFWTRNVRLITFLICALLILSVFGPISIIYIDDYIQSMEQDDRPQMTVEELRAVAEAAKSLNRKALERFRGERSENGENENRTVTYQISIGERYFLMAGFYVETEKVYYLTLTDLEKNTDLDLLDRNADLDAFLK